MNVRAYCQWIVVHAGWNKRNAGQRLLRIKNEFIFSFGPHSTRMTGIGSEKAQSFGSWRLTANPEKVGHERMWIS